MSNIEKLAAFIDERDPEGKIFPVFVLALEIALAAGWKSEGRNNNDYV